MPFTPAHAAAVVPFVSSRRVTRVLDPVALVLGSMALDFEYFLHGRMQGFGAHSWWGVFAFGLPVTLSLWLFFHLVLKKPLWLSLPRVLRERCPLPAEGRVPQLFLGAVVGVSTHILWDSMTHRTGFFVEAVPQMESAFFGMALYRWFQHGSTVLGLSLLLAFLIYQLRRKTLPETERFRSASYGLVLPTAAVLGALTAGVLVGVGSIGSRVRLGHLVVGVIDGVLIGTAVAAIGLTLAAKCRPTMVVRSAPIRSSGG